MSLSDRLIFLSEHRLGVRYNVGEDEIIENLNHNWLAPFEYFDITKEIIRLEREKWFFSSKNGFEEMVDFKIVSFMDDFKIGDAMTAIDQADLRPASILELFSWGCSEYKDLFPLVLAPVLMKCPNYLNEFIYGFVSLGGNYGVNMFIYDHEKKWRTKNCYFLVVQQQKPCS
jgi:hypothetical protein